MKQKVKKLAAVAISLLLAGNVAVFAACKPDDGKETHTQHIDADNDGKCDICGEDMPDEPGGGDEDLTLKSLIIDKTPEKVDYIVGEKVDLTGIGLKVEWSDGLKEAVDVADCTYTPDGALSVSDKEVVITYTSEYGTVSAKQSITVTDIAATELKVNVGQVSLTGAANTPMDLSKITVSAVYEDGQERPVDAGSYTATVDGKEVDLSSVVFTERGDHKVVIGFKGLTASFTVNIINGYIVEAEHAVASKDVDESYEGTSYVEKVVGGFKSIFKDAESNPAPESCSGDGYLGSVFNGNVLRFHLWAEEEGYVNVILRASSAYMLEDGGSWSPMKMGDEQFNKMFDIRYGSAADLESGSLKSVYIDNDVVLEGGETDKLGGDIELYTNWKDVTFGSIKLSKGDNLIEMEVISDYKNCRGEIVACNIDRLEVENISEDEYQPSLSVTGISLKTEAAKTTYKSGEFFDATGMEIEAVLSDGTKRQVDINECKIMPDGALTVNDTKITVSWKGFEATQDITVESAGYDSIYIEGETLVEIGAQPEDGLKNYVQVIRNGSDINSGNVKVQNTEAAEFVKTSGGKYLNGLCGSAEPNKGAIVDLHIWSDKDVTVKIVIYASSPYMTQGNGWQPTKTEDLQFNQVFKLSFGQTTEALADLTVDDSLIVAGGELINGETDMRLWENWQEVVLGTFELKAGDNILRLENINTTMVNMVSQTVGLNIDRFEIRIDK